MPHEPHGAAEVVPTEAELDVNPPTVGVELAHPVFSRHAEQRHQQRAIPEWAIDLALRARPQHSHGALVYRVTDRLLLQLGREDLADRLRGLTVVTGTDGVIVTVKWDERLRRRGCLRRSRLGRRGTTPLMDFRRRPAPAWRTGLVGA